MTGLLVSLLILLSAGTAAATKAILVYDGDVVGKTDHLDIKGTDYLPLKTVAEAFKTPIQKPASAKFISGTIYAPASFFAGKKFSDAVECDIEWDPDTLTLSGRRRATLSAPRILSLTSEVRIAFEFAQPMEYRDRLAGRMITVEIPKARIADEETVRIKDPVIESVALTRMTKGAQIKIALAQAATDYHAFMAEDPLRLIIQIKNPKAPQDSADEDKIVQLLMGEVKKVNKSGLKIAVDAGHGGEDYGASGRGGTREKDINLMVARELARQFKLEGYDVFLTRKSDAFISLGDRSLLANQEGADIFISIHCNAAASRRKREGGFEIYFLSEDATDQEAEDVSRFENMEPERTGLLTDENKKAAQVLFSMARTEFINESSLLCHMVSRAVDRRVPISNRGVKQADFHVLHGVQMPSILVEMAFIDLPSEEKKLRQRKFRTAMVDAVVTGVQNFEKKVSLLK